MRNLAFTSLLILLSACAEQRAGSEPPEPPGPRAAATPPASEPSGGAPVAAAGTAGPGPAASAVGSEGAGEVGVSSEGRASNGSGVISAAEVGGTASRAPVPDGLIVHEWGTFTSVNGSTGVLMEGLHHEEEALPQFVYGRNTVIQTSSDPDAAVVVNGVGGGKALEGKPVGVTQKLETPVLYFYGPAKKGVRVRVDFPTGVISQWFPNATQFGPALGTVQVPHSGFMQWQFDMAPEMTGADFPVVSPDDIWAPSRNVASVPVAVGAERERFIFYRGLGAFELPLRITIDATDHITIDNRSSDVSPAVFLLRVHPGGGAIVELGALPGGGVMPGILSPISGKERNLDLYVAEAQDRIAAALVGTGLYPDEARAMVDTWTKSYFRSEGLRVLYVVPRAWTDKLLPLSVEPAPAAVVRTLVGRVELLAPSEEKALLARVKDASARALTVDGVVPGMGRLAEPKLRRVLQLATDPGVRAWTEQAIEYATVMP